MARTHVKVTATVPDTLVAQLDALVAAHEYPSRSAAIEAALTTLLRAHMDARTEAEAAKLEASEEQQLADEGLNDYTVLVGEEGTF
jgi:Arc/MetJ-type ribon-helix-helix transcriptional regulator